MILNCDDTLLCLVWSLEVGVWLVRGKLGKFGRNGNDRLSTI